jgi:hypothetical protein
MGSILPGREALERALNEIERFVFEIYVITGT